MQVTVTGHPTHRWHTITQQSIGATFDVCDHCQASAGSRPGSMPCPASGYYGALVPVQITAHTIRPGDLLLTDELATPCADQAVSALMVQPDQVNVFQQGDGRNIEGIDTLVWVARLPGGDD